ncbi:MAG TPA: O-antigen ligase family protein [Gemmatimonadales bacterium]|nr:O-antigen ligase family protein [Gemmatimonadales bacterium]
MSKLAYAALWVFVFTVSAEPTFRGFGVVPSRVTGPVAVGLTLLTIVLTGRLRRWHPFHITALLFVAWIGLGLLFFYTQWLELPNRFWTYIQLFLVLWIVWETAATRSRQRGLMGAYVLGASVSAIDTIILFQRKAEMMRRFAAGGVDNNDLAMMLALAIPMAWYLATTSRQLIRRWLCTAYLPIALFAIGLTGSRGGMLTTMIALLIVPLTLTRLSPLRRGIAIGLLWISGAFALAYVPQTLMERLASTTGEVEEGGIGGRMKIWIAGLRAFTASPLVGHGPASFIRAVDPYLIARAQVAHNSFLSVLVESGLPGFLLFFGMFLTAFLAILKLPYLERRYSLVLFFALGLSTLPLSSEESKRVWIVLALLVGLSQAYVNSGVGGPLGTRLSRPAVPPGGPAQRREPMTLPLRTINRKAAE